MIEIKKVSKKYNEIYAIKDISIKIKDQKVTCIIGPSGSGKSTLLRCVACLDKPDYGSVLVDSVDVLSLSREELSGNVGMVFQNFNLFASMSVIENLIYAPLKLKQFDSKERALIKAKALLEDFSLGTKLNDSVHSLSGGQKQRVAICRAMMRKPKIMLFDEPTSALDSEKIKDIIEVILKLKSKLTMVIVTHHMQFAKAVADEVVFMDNGCVLSVQQKDDFFQKPKSHRARLFLENCSYNV